MGLSERDLNVIHTRPRWEGGCGARGARSRGMQAQLSRAEVIIQPTGPGQSWTFCPHCQNATSPGADGVVLAVIKGPWPTRDKQVNRRDWRHARHKSLTGLSCSDKS